MRTMIAAVVLAGRRIQPAAFAVTLASLAVGLTWLGAERVDGPYELAIGAGGLVIAGILTAGWFGNALSVMRCGLLGAVGLWLLVAYVAWVGVGSLTSALLALAWVVLAGGSYFMETVEARRLRAVP
jgi:hypothetical protein